MPNLAELLTRSAAAHPDRTAIKLDDRELSYAELAAASAQVAGLLAAKGVGPGDRVGIMLPNVPYFAACYYGALRAGAAVVPMNVLLKEREVAFYLSDSGARVLLAWHEFADAAHAGAEQAGAECVLVEPGELEALLARCEPAADDRARPARHGRDPLHVRHDRARRRAPSSPTTTCCATSRSASGCSGSTSAPSRSARCRCSTPSARPAGSTRRSPSADA